MSEVGERRPVGTWRQDPRSLRIGLVAGVAALIALAAAVCALSLADGLDAVNQRASASASNVATLAARDASSIIDRAAVALDSTAIQLDDQIAAGGIDHARLWTLVDRMRALMRGVSRIGVFDAAGHQVCGLPAARCRQLDVAGRDYFQRLRADPGSATALFGPYASLVDGQRELILARALRDPGGRFAGIVVAELPPPIFDTLLAAIDLGPRGFAALVTESAELIARRPAPPAVAAGATTPRRSANFDREERAHPAGGVYRARSSLDGIDRWNAYRHLDGWPLYMMVGLARDEYTERWRTQAEWEGGFLALLAASSIAITGLLLGAMRRQQQVHELYDRAPCGYHSIDEAGMYREINDTELGWLGCRREEVVGRLRPTDFYAAEEHETFERNLEKLRTSGRVEGVEYDLVGRDGRRRRVLVGATMSGEPGSARRLSRAVMSDITELHEARSALERLAHEQAVMLDNDLIGSVRLREGRIVWHNKAVEHLFDHDAAALQQLPLERLLARAEDRERIESGLDSGRPLRIQVEARNGRGEILWLDLYGVATAREPREAICFLADISALRAAENQRLRAAELESESRHLEQAMAIKTRFLANVSHEMRTPLHAILGFAELLRRQPGTEKQQRFTEHIESSGRLLLGLIDSLLDLTQVESGKMDFRPEALDPARLVADVIEMQREAIDAKHIQATLDADAALGAVLVDPLRLQQIVQHLLANAVKFTPAGGRVGLRLRAEGETHFRIEVEDNGIGIAEADMPRLFSSFSQLDDGLNRRYEGSGVGLALVRRLVEAQGGTVGVRSAPGQGSVFQVVLPRRA